MSYTEASGTADPLHSPLDQAAAQVVLNKTASETVAGLLRLVEDLARARVADAAQRCKEMEAREQAAHARALKLEDDLITRSHAAGDALHARIKAAEEASLARIQSMGKVGSELAGMSFELLLRAEQMIKPLLTPPPPQKTAGDNVEGIAREGLAQVGKVLQIALLKDPELAERAKGVLGAIADLGEQKATAAKKEAPPAAARSAQKRSRYTTGMLSASVDILGGLQGAWFRRFADENGITSADEFTLEHQQTIIDTAQQVFDEALDTLGGVSGEWVLEYLAAKKYSSVEELKPPDMAEIVLAARRVGA